MKLTGKCKEEFEKWFSEEQVFDLGDIYNGFYGMGYNCQYGVYVDYFDSVGINVDLQPVYNYTKENYSSVVYFIINVIELGKLDDNYKLIEEKNRLESRTTAIEKADELRNKFLNK